MLGTYEAFCGEVLHTVMDELLSSYDNVCSNATSDDASYGLFARFQVYLAVRIQYRLPVHMRLIGRPTVTKEVISRLFIIPTRFEI